MAGFDSIIFDLDGTLWDTSEACVVGWNNVLARNGIKFNFSSLLATIDAHEGA